MGENRQGGDMQMGKMLIGATFFIKSLLFSHKIQSSSL